MNVRCLVLVTICLLLGVKCQSAAVEEKFHESFRHTFNDFRSKMKVQGMRKLYFDQELVREAKSKAENCDREPLSDGNVGSFSIGMGEFRAPVTHGIILDRSADGTTLIRNTYDRPNGLCKSDSEEKICRESLQFYNPKAWLIGCAINYKCEKETLVVCTMNRRVTDTKHPLWDPTQGQMNCTQSFEAVCPEEEKKKYNCLCKLKDSSRRRNLPEDAQELVQPRTNELEEETGNNGLIGGRVARQEDGLIRTVNNSAFKHIPFFPTSLFILLSLLTLHFH